MTTEPEISLRRLGRTQIEVTPIGLGVMQFSGRRGYWRWMFQDISQAEMNRIVQAALAGGINWFDTAEVYGGGRSERGLARALHAAGRNDDEVLVATKWFPLFRTAGSIPRTVKARIRYLDGYSIGLYMVHRPWGFSSPEAEMEAMADLVDRGVVGAVGVSNFSAERMRRAHAALERRGIPLAVNQVHYSLLQRRIETDGVLETARELGVTIIAWSPLEQGLLSGKFHRSSERLRRTPLARRLMLQAQLERSLPVIEALEDIGVDRGVTAAQVALNWLIHNAGGAVVAIPGASQVRHAEEAAGAMQFSLSEAEWGRLESLSRPFR